MPPPRFLPAGVFTIPELGGFQAQLDLVPGPGLIHFLVKTGQPPQQAGGAQAGSKLGKSVTGAQEVMNRSPSKAFEPTRPDTKFTVRGYLLQESLLGLSCFCDENTRRLPLSSQRFAGEGPGEKKLFVTGNVLERCLNGLPASFPRFLTRPQWAR